MSLSMRKSLSIVSLLKLFITAEDTPFRFRLPLERHHSIQISLKFKPLELNRPFILRHILKGTRTHTRSNRLSGKPRCYNPWDWPERRAYSILGTTVKYKMLFLGISSKNAYLMHCHDEMRLKNFTVSSTKS